MKKTNSVVLLIVALLLIIIGGGIYFAQRSGRLNLFADFAGWPDVPTTDPAYTELMAIGERGWMNGYADGTFQPDWDATRAMVVVGEIRARGDVIVDSTQTCVPNNPSTYPFTDVPCDHWAIDEILTAKNAGIIDGFPDGSFRPDTPAASRAEVVVLIVKGKEWQVPDYQCDNSLATTFPDVPCDYWAYDYIRLAKERGIIFGYSSGNFEPETTATRRDLGVILYRAYITSPVEVTISGRITNAITESGIAGASVYVVDAAAQGSRLETQADSTGAYSLSFVSAATTYTIRAAATGYQSKTTSISAAQSATLNFALSPVSQNEGVITGYVRNADTRSAIAGATVTVVGYESGSQLSDRTDSRGYYSLRVGSTTGTFSVKASATGYRSKTSSVTLSSGSGYLSFALSKVDQPPTGDQPDVNDGTGGNVNAARTGSVLPVALVLLGTILALFSLIYLLKTNKQNA